MINFLTLRNFSEQLKRLARIVEDAPPSPPDRLRRWTAINLSRFDVRKGNEKRYPGLRDVGKIRYMVGHVTDVRGGFGVQKWGPDGWKTWRTKLDSAKIDGRILADFRRELGGISDDELAHALALGSRYAQLPYHRIASRRLGECINRPLFHKTWASTALNDGVAMGVDCHHKEPIDVDLAAAGRNMFHRLFFDLRDARRSAGEKGPVVYVVHGQGAANRKNDTYRIAHLAIYKPAALELQAAGEDIEIGYEVALGSGRPLTTRDDPDAHFDERYRRIRTPEGEML